MTNVLRTLEFENRPSSAPYVVSHPPKMQQGTSEVEYDAAQQLIQHAQEGRLKLNGDSRKYGRTVHGTEYSSWEDENKGRYAQSDRIVLQQEQDPSFDQKSQKNVPDSGCGSTNNTPKMGQICR